MVTDRQSRLYSVRRVTLAGAAALLVAPLLASCVGWPSSPEKSGLPPEKLGGYCVGTSTTYLIDGPADVGISLRPTIDKLRETVLLEVHIAVPPGADVRLAGDSVLARSPEWPETKRLPITEVVIHDPNLMPGPGRGTDREKLLPTVRMLWYGPRGQTMAPQTGLPQAKELTFVLPPLAINGALFQPEPATFHRYYGTRWFGCPD